MRLQLSTEFYFGSLPCVCSAGRVFFMKSIQLSAKYSWRIMAEIWRILVFHFKFSPKNVPGTRQGILPNRKRVRKKKKKETPLNRWSLILCMWNLHGKLTVTLWIDDNFLLLFTNEGWEWLWLGLSNKYSPQTANIWIAQHQILYWAAKTHSNIYWFRDHAVYWLCCLTVPQYRRVSDVYQIWIKPWLTRIHQTCPAGPDELNRVWRFMKLPRIFCTKRKKKIF